MSGSFVPAAAEDLDEAHALLDESPDHEALPAEGRKNLLIFEWLAGEFLHQRPRDLAWIAHWFRRFLRVIDAHLFHVGSQTLAFGDDRFAAQHQLEGAVDLFIEQGRVFLQAGGKGSRAVRDHIAVQQSERLRRHDGDIAVFAGIVRIRLGWFVFHKLPADTAVLRLTDEVTLLFGAIVVVPFEGAAAVRGNGQTIQMAFREAVIVTIEDRLKIEVPKLIQHGIRVRRAVRDAGSERKMSEQHRGLSLVQPGQILPQPFKRGRLNDGLLIAQTIRRIQPNELPASMMEVVIHAQWIGVGVSAPVRLRDEIVVAHHGIHRTGQHAEDVLHRLQIFAFAFLGQVTGMNTKLGIRLLHLRDHALQIRTAFLAHAMRVVDGEKAK